MKRALVINSAILLIAIWISLNVGATKLPNIVELMSGNGDLADRTIFFDIRLPRIIAALAVGIALGVSGVLAQAVTRNNLAEPGILGTTSGAALLALVAILAGIADVGTPQLALIATVGGLISTSGVFYLARNSLNGLSLVIMGIAISATLSGFVGILASIVENPNAKGVTFWSLGTLSLATKENARIISITTALLTALAFLYARRLDYLALGDIRASHLGISPTRVRGTSLLLMATIIGFVTSTFGSITFIALATPHIARAIYGVTHQRLVVGSAVTGATLLLIADTVSRTLISPSELPISLLTAIIGAPILAFAAYRTLRRS